MRAQRRSSFSAFMPHQSAPAATTQGPLQETYLDLSTLESRLVDAAHTLVAGRQVIRPASSHTGSSRTQRAQSQGDPPQANAPAIPTQTQAASLHVHLQQGNPQTAAAATAASDTPPSSGSAGSVSNAFSTYVHHVAADEAEGAQTKPGT